MRKEERKAATQKPQPRSVCEGPGSTLFVARMSGESGWQLYEELSGGMKVRLAKFANADAAQRFLYWAEHIGK